MTDVLVIGGGVNGLVAAARLATAGKSVRLVERRALLGGLAAGEEFHPGYRHTGILHDTRGVREAVVAGLGLDVRRRDDGPGTYVPETSGPGVLIHPNVETTRADLARRSVPDADAWVKWRRFLRDIGPFIRKLTDEAPLPLDGGRDVLWRALKTGLAWRKLGEANMLEVLRIMPMCAADWLEEWFADRLLAAALCGSALEATWTGPWSAGSTLNLVLAEAAADREIAGGPAALVAALEEKVREARVDVHLDAAVRCIRLQEGGVRGVDLADGTSFDAPCIVATCDPKTTLLDLVSPRDLPVELQRPVMNVRSRGTTAKVHLALNGPLQFSGREGAFEAARTGECVDDIERAFDAVKYGEYSKTPWLDIRVPTVHDPSLAPSGHHVVSILVHYAPFDLRAGWDDAAREALGDAVVDRLATYAPSVTDRIVAREVLTPVDLAERYGLAGGHLHHGELALDQCLSMRPVPACGTYVTPIPGLFLGGAGSHPGGGVTGMPGWLAAGTV